ncbi:Asparagine synthase [Seminavis robusta]|uniref:Asparagine synthase n=1 Tax=Seminavis robusta TaxID=568900 RepID=A0A9N8DHL2_9STRA|nr:Asparagine synthase [Seminavis robusta]|eukprot:Sro125_g060130.1 Asparagine synthase (457) ;mRNA; f:22824-24194
MRGPLSMSKLLVSRQSTKSSIGVRRWGTERTSQASAFSRTFTDSSTQPSSVVVSHHSSSIADGTDGEHPTRVQQRINNKRTTYNPEREDATKLVDELLLRTRSLMNEPIQSTSTSHHNHDKADDVHVLRHVVAFSGGIDSSLVLALLMKAKEDQQQLVQQSTSSSLSIQESVHAVLGTSPAVPQDQIRLAQQVADHIGIPLVQIATTEGSDDTYIQNQGQACLACKTHLYTALQAVAQHAVQQDELLLLSQSSNNNYQQQQHQLYNGTNADDVQDATRVGLIAARNFDVQSPLLRIPKHDVRRAAQHLGLPNWNVAASPCLRSRLALGVEATQDHLQRIERAEAFVRNELQIIISETTNLRVRLLANNRAMLEMDAELLPHVPLQSTTTTTTKNNKTKQSWESYFVQTLGFASIQARAFRSGSVAATASTTNNATANAQNNITRRDAANDEEEAVA